MKKRCARAKHMGAIRPLKPGEYCIISTGKGRTLDDDGPWRCLGCHKPIGAGDRWRMMDNGQYKVIWHLECWNKQGC